MTITIPDPTDLVAAPAAVAAVVVAVLAAGSKLYGRHHATIAPTAARAGETVKRFLVGRTVALAGPVLCVAGWSAYSDQVRDYRDAQAALPVEQRRYPIANPATTLPPPERVLPMAMGLSLATMLSTAVLAYHLGRWAQPRK